MINNTAALEHFGELYKASWTKLSERFDDVPHYEDIAASFDKITATEQGRALVYLFNTTRQVPFRTEGGDLVATRNRAAFMIALAQYKRELAAGQSETKPAAPAAQPATKPAPRRGRLFPIENEGASSRLDKDWEKVYLCIRNGTLCLDVLVNGFFPLTQANESKILPQIAGALDAATGAGLHKILCGMMQDKHTSDADKKRLAHNLSTLAALLAQKPGFEALAAQYETAAGNAAKELDDAADGVEMGKRESYRIACREGYEYRIGQRITKGGATFHFCHEKHGWVLTEEYTGLTVFTAKTKTQLIDWLKGYDTSALTPELLQERRRWYETHLRNAA